MSVDREFRVDITGDASSAIAASKAASDAMARAANEVERYEAKLRQMAIGAKAAEQAQRNLAQVAEQAAKSQSAAAATSESDRYQATLQRMAEASGTKGGGDDGWFAGVQARRAATIAALKAEGQAGQTAMEQVSKATVQAVSHPGATHFPRLCPMQRLLPIANNG